MTDMSATSINKVGGTTKKKGKKVKKNKKIVQPVENHAGESDANTVTGGGLSISPI